VSRFAESVVEDAALAWLESLGWSVKHGPDIAPGELGAERADYAQVVVLETRLREALGRLNPQLPAEALADAFRRLTRPEGPERPGLALQSAEHDPFVWPTLNLAISRPRPLRGPSWPSLRVVSKTTQHGE